MLIDATEDVIPLLNRAGIQRIDHLFVTHWHPDHTAGFRVVEQANLDLTNLSPRVCTEVWLNAATAAIMPDAWRYFERRGYCHLNVVTPGTRLDLGHLTATWFNYAPDGFLSGFLLDDGHARALLALDETKDLAGQIAADPDLQSCDLFIAACGLFDRDPEDRVLVPDDSPLWATEESFDRDTLPLLAAARANRTILTHLMDLHGRTPAELGALAATLAPYDVQFAYDGLTVTL